MRLSRRIFALIPIGHSGSVEEDRRIDQGIKLNGGWHGLCQRLEPVTRAFDGIIFKNPGGCLSDEPMQLTQWSQAKAAGLNWLTDDFDAAMEPFAARMRALDRERIFYLGGYAGDKNVLAGRFDAAMWKDSILTFARYGSIGLDAQHNIAGMGAIGPAAQKNAERIAALLRYMDPDATTYAEPYPHVSDDYVNGHKFGAVLSNQNAAAWDYDNSWRSWMKQDFAGNPERVIVFIEQPPAGETWENSRNWMRAECEKYLSRGWSVAYNPNVPMVAPVDLGLTPSFATTGE